MKILWMVSVWMWIWMGCDGVIVFVVPCVGVDVSVNFKMFGLNVAWRLIGECVQSYHFLDTRRNWYIVDSNFCSEI